MSCSLCELPTPDPPITADDVEGSYCCRGCLEVVRALGDGDPEAVDANESEVEEALATGEIDTAADTTSGDSATGADSDADEVTFLRVEGMHCSTCEAFLEGTLGRVDGVASAEANYPADLVRVEHDSERVEAASLPDHVDRLGYIAGLSTDAPEETEDRTTARLLVGGFFGMMAMLWYVLFLYPRYLGLPARYLLVDLGGGASGYLLWNVWLAATVVLGYTGAPILRGAYVSLRAGLPNMDLLVALAASTAYVYSTLVLLLGGVEVYFDVTVAVVLVVTLGERYEKRVKAKAAGRLTELTENRVDSARRRVDADDGTRIEEVSVDRLAAGDEVVVRTGERVPVDGTVVEGEAACDESLLTGESRPVRREAGDEAVGGSLVVDGRLVVSVSAEATSTIDRLVRFLWQVQSSRHGAQRLADRLATVFVPLVVTVALVAFGWQLGTGATLTGALLTGLTVLVVSCPCALGLATPLATAAGVRAALDEGVVVTDASLFEGARETEIVALDKTGTLTTGGMTLHRTAGDDAALARAAAVERFADHPVADAVAAAADPVDATVTDFTRHPGRGAAATIDGDRVVVGRRDLLDEQDFVVPDELADAYADARDAGDVPSLVGWGGRARGLLVVGDEPRPGWEAVVDELAARVEQVVVLTGDGEAAARAFADHSGIDHVLAGVRPEAKAEVVRRLRERGPVTMVGDGSNDAPALAAADVGVAMAEGTRLAADAADAVVVDDDLAALPRVFELTRQTNRRVRGNLAWAFLYNAVAIPLAATGLLNPLFAAVAMSASSLLVVANSARGFGKGDQPESARGRTPNTVAGRDAEAAD